MQQQIAIIENQTNPSNVKTASDNLVSHLISPKDGTQRFGIYHKNMQSFTNPSTPTISDEHPMLQPRNRFGVILTQANGQPLDVPSSILDAITPTSNPNDAASKQGSPFYAEPADSLSNPVGIGNIIKRTQRNVAVPSSQRFSEPPKGPMIPFKNGFSNLPNSMEKNHQLSGSLDELKKRNRKARGRLDPWPLDSSWEFMGNEDNDYDTDVNWNGKPNAVNENNKEKNNRIQIVDSVPKQALTVQQIIAKKLPDLDLPEQLRCSTPIQDVNGKINGGGTLLRGQRISAYDNVERGQIASYGYATTASLLMAETANSDDGTVFSEPWDSSQWDNFFPQDDTSESIHFSKCRPACLSEDDTTLVEDASLLSTRPPPASKHPKVATIFRSRSCRDREILCK